jgi:adenylosuccinate synthase
MPVTAVVGAQWGDEGKGKIVDLMAQNADVVVRYAGGSNAGHTIVNEYGSFKLHSLPSGAFNPGALNIVGTGTVVDFDSLSTELAQLRTAGVGEVSLTVSDRAHVIMPYHKALDRMHEDSRGDLRVGTTGQGIGPTYADKVERSGIQAGELLDLARLEQRLGLLLRQKNRIVENTFGGAPMDPAAVVERVRSWHGEFRGNIRDTVPLLRRAVAEDRRILLEGQLGVMRDLDWGTYPYVTSSTTFAAGAGAGAGVPPRLMTDVVGVVKAYTTAVGEGPVPTELHGAEAHHLRDLGNEYGATTGRPRRVGWLDGIALRYAAHVGAFTRLALTKLDILDGFEELKIGVAYQLDRETVEEFPHPMLLARVEPVYEVLPGWSQSTAGARSWMELPENARRYVRRIEELAGVPVSLIGVGEAREAIIDMASFEPVGAVA